MIHRPKLPILILIVVLAGSSVLYLALLTPNRFGLYHDDGIYVTNAKALATGQGYRTISLPYEPAQTKYPPFYPFLLSLIWQLQPEFPGNLKPMMLLSLLTTMGFLVVTWRYLIKGNYASRQQALLIVTMSALNWRTALFATSILSEMVYAAISVAGLCLAEKYASESKSWSRAMVLGVVMGLTFLTRASGAALLIGAGLWSLLRRNSRVLFPVGVGGLFVIAWAGWSHIHITSAEGVNVAYYTSYFRDLSEVVRNLQADGNASGLAVLTSLIGRNVLGLVLVSAPLVSSGFNDEWLPELAGYRLLVSLCFIIFGFTLMAAGFLRHSRGGLRLLHVYLLSYLGLHLLWPYATYDRFLMPILPFLLLFLVIELQTLIALVVKETRSNGHLVERLGGGFLGLVLLAAICLTFYSYGAGIYRSLGSMEKLSYRASEDAQTVEWIKTHTDPSDVIICSRDPVYYLYTGRKATRSYRVN